jgi:hypothetical protein
MNEEVDPKILQEVLIQLEKENKEMCDCSCHIHGTNIIHFMACCKYSEVKRGCFPFFDIKETKEPNG